MTSKSEFTSIVDAGIQASMFIVEGEYVEQTPVDSGLFAQLLEVVKIENMHHEVQSKAKANGYDYPYALYHGTGKLKDAPDYGFTSGRVRSGRVAYGIGGIRPNKVSDRAVASKGKEVLKFAQTIIKNQL